ncbi:MAG TPA: hypothetical protein VHN77_01955 [Phycisphaerales bacterium]|nr:hypothetical protein [Phycisphaerales bacterium]
MRTPLLLVVASSAFAAGAWADVPPALTADLARHVWTDSPLAQVRVVNGQGGAYQARNGDAGTIVVTAPAKALVRVGPDAHAPIDPFTTRAGTPQDLPIGTAPEGDAPQDVEFHPGGASYFVLHRFTRNIIRFDAATNTPIQTYALSGQLPVAMDITPDGATLLVAYYTEDQLGVVDVAGGTETVIATGDAPGTVTITPDGTRALIGCMMDSTLRVINVATLTEERSIAMPDFTQTISFGTESGVVDVSFAETIEFLDASRVVFPGRWDSLVSVIDFTTGARTDVTTGQFPAGASVAGNGSIIAVSHATSNGITTIIDPTTLAVSRVIQSPGSNTWANGPIILNATGTKAVIAFQNSARVLDLTTDTFGAGLGTANLEDLALNAAGTRVVGIGYSGAVIDLTTGSLLGTPNSTVSCTRGAVSPITDRAVLASWPTFGDDIVVIETDATPAQIFFGRSGPGPEGDVARNGAISPNGAAAVSANLLSRNMSIFDTASGALLHYATLGPRPGEVEITPDSARAVALNVDGTNVSIVNLSTGATTPAPSATRLAQVEIDPAGAFAYVSQVASGDGVRKLNLATNAFVGGLTATGDMGSVGYAYSQMSQIALSPDGSLLATAGGFNDRLDIVNTSTMTAAQTFTPLGTFITRAAWSPEGDELLVSDRDADMVHVLRRPSPSDPFAVVGTIPTGDQPYDSVLVPGSSRAFVLNCGTPYSVTVLDIASLSAVSTILLPRLPVGLSLNADGSQVSILTINEQTTIGQGNFIRTLAGELTVIDTATLTTIDVINTNQTASMLTANATGTAFACPAMSSEVLTVITPPSGCDSIDFNNDGLFPDTQDIADFLVVFAGGPCSNDPNCGDIDFNNDALFPDTQDIQSLISVFGGGACL